MKNINELIESQTVLYKDLREGAVEHFIAKELNNAAGKIIAATKVQLEYAELRKEVPNIKFLNTK